MLLDQNLRKGADLVKLALKVVLWKRFGKAWRSLGGAPEEVLGVLGGLGRVAGLRMPICKICKVFDPKLGSMLGQKNVFFDVENWKNGVPRGVAKKVRFWSDFLVKKMHFLKVGEMQK